jgi:hypothetical protein
MKIEQHTKDICVSSINAKTNCPVNPENEPAKKQRYVRDGLIALLP